MRLVCGEQKRSPGCGWQSLPPNFFIYFYQMDNFMGQLFFKISKVFIFTCKIRNVLNEWKINFPYFVILRYGRFCSQNWSIFRCILRTKSTIIQKMKIRNLIFQTFQLDSEKKRRFRRFWEKNPRNIFFSEFIFWFLRILWNIYRSEFERNQSKTKFFVEILRNLKFGCFLTKDVQTFPPTPLTEEGSLHIRNWKG